ncbi:MAG TPA: carbohydrate kinase family protein, partial [Candidatus Eisenbacteria bacterium]|nr:carbohydrate kinase family protein [Candidatus Eisenbacteria bacterium]
PCPRARRAYGIPRAGAAPRRRAGVTPDLVCLGNLIVDDLVFADGRTRMGEPGGAIAYVALGARLWNVGVGVVGPLGSDYPRDSLEGLHARGVDISGLRPLPGPGLRTWLLHEPCGRRVIHRLDSADHFEASPRPDDVPAAWRAARAIHLAPMPLARQRELVASLAPTAGMLSLDPHETVSVSNADAWREVVRHVDVFIPNDEELAGAREAPEQTLRAWRAALGDPGRLKFVLLKQGARGGLALDARTGATTRWRPRAERVVDATGAGDAFAGGWLAAWLEQQDLQAALEQGVVSASFVLEDWGLAALSAATPAAARLRRQAWFGRVASG